MHFPSHSQPCTAPEQKCNSYIAVLDHGKVVDEFPVWEANLVDITKQSASSKTVSEALSNYYAIYDTLNEYLDIVIADPYQTKVIDIVEVKSNGLNAKLRE